MCGEILRTLIEAEITARDASNAAARLKGATFPVLKTIDGFDVAASSIPQATFDYLTGLEWLRGKANLALIGPPGTGKSHTLIALRVRHRRHDARRRQRRHPCNRRPHGKPPHRRQAPSPLQPAITPGR